MEKVFPSQFHLSLFFLFNFKDLGDSLGLPKKEIINFSRFWVFNFKLYDLLLRFIYLFNWFDETGSHKSQARLELLILLLPLPKCWDLLSYYEEQLFPLSRLKLVIAEDGPGHEWCCIPTGRLQLGVRSFFEGEGSVLENLFGLLGFSKSGEKVVSACWIVSSMIDRAQLLWSIWKLLGPHSAKL